MSSSQLKFHLHLKLNGTQYKHVSIKISNLISHDKMIENIVFTQTKKLRNYKSILREILLQKLYSQDETFFNTWHFDMGFCFIHD